MLYDSGQNDRFTWGLGAWGHAHLNDYMTHIRIVTPAATTDLQHKPCTQTLAAGEAGEVTFSSSLWSEVGSPASSTTLRPNRVPNLADQSAMRSVARACIGAMYTQRAAPLPSLACTWSRRMKHLYRVDHFHVGSRAWIWLWLWLSRPFTGRTLQTAAD
jgi:hypothetical protein